MTVLGKVSIYIPKGQAIAGVVLMDENNKPVGGTGINPITPTDGDTITVEMLEKLE